MLTKKFIAIAGSSVLILALLTGVTYAWFTNTQKDTPAVIEAGKLGIAFKVTDNTKNEIPLYPRETLKDRLGEEYPAPTVEETEAAMEPDVAEQIITLKNESSRGVLVKISGGDMTVKGSKADPKAPHNVDESTRGKVILKNTDALMFKYTMLDPEIKYLKIGKDFYIYLPDSDSEWKVRVQVWIDGAHSGNEYQSANISFSELTATAVQYKEAAIMSSFKNLTPKNLRDFVTEFGVDFDA